MLLCSKTAYLKVVVSPGKYLCTIDLLFDWFGLVCFANKNKTVSCHTADSRPVKQEVNGTVILPSLVFPGITLSGNVCGFAQSNV